VGEPVGEVLLSESNALSTYEKLRVILAAIGGEFEDGTYLRAMTPELVKLFV
jgi:hypothetical protein